MYFYWNVSSLHQMLVCMGPVAVCCLMQRRLTNKKVQRIFRRVCEWCGVVHEPPLKLKHATAFQWTWCLCTLIQRVRISVFGHWIPHLGRYVRDYALFWFVLSSHASLSTSGPLHHNKRPLRKFPISSIFFHYIQNACSLMALVTLATCNKLQL